MSALKFLLIPFSWIFGIITGIRNFLYNKGVFKSYVIPGKSIVVGNLSVGGTGKTPHVDYLIQYTLDLNLKPATLSRGYGRDTKGCIEATEESLTTEVGDEPAFYKQKYGDGVPVVVSESRKLGVDYIQNKYGLEKVIILDDAFQHRKVRAGLNIVITEYSKPFSKDYLLPAGRLRESRNGLSRADILIVSKCPADLNNQEQDTMIKELKFPRSKTFFSSIKYGELVGFKSSLPNEVKNVLLVTGIGNSSPLLTYLESYYNVQHLKFKDHHQFSSQDCHDIHQKFDTFASRDKIIITTEKDAMRLREMDEVSEYAENWFYLPITIEITNQKEFNHLIESYVRKD